MSLNKVDNDAGQGPSKPMGGLAFDLLIADIVAEAKNRSTLKYSWLEIFSRSYTPLTMSGVPKEQRTERP